MGTPTGTVEERAVDWSTFTDEALRLVAATVLGALIGLERQFHQKNAGVRTHALVGLGAALFTIVGMHPWLLAHTPTSGDAMRVAAQVVSGIGFLGAGVIFVNRDAVKGLTTAAAIWVSAAIGMACGASMVPLAAVAAALYLLILLGVSPLLARMPGRDRHLLVHLTYLDHAGTLRRAPRPPRHPHGRGYGQRPCIQQHHHGQAVPARGWGRGRLALRRSGHRRPQGT